MTKEQPAIEPSGLDDPVHTEPVTSPTSAAWSGCGPASRPVSEAGVEDAEAGRIRWLARGEHELPTNPAWLTASERRRAATLRFTKRRTEFLLRRWTGKQAVAAALGWPISVDELARIEVTNHPTGAPYVLLDASPSTSTSR